MEIQALSAVETLVSQWQAALGSSVKVALGGSLTSGLFVFDEQTEVIDVDIRFLVENPQDERVRQAIEDATGLRYRKKIAVRNWPAGQSVGVMVEGIIEIPGLALPLEIEGCIRNPRYVGWAKFYPVVLSQDELAAIRLRKAQLRSDKKAYKAFKQDVLADVQRRVTKQGLL